MTQISKGLFIDVVRTTLYLDDRPSVSALGYVRAPTAAKTFQLHLVFEPFLYEVCKQPVGSWGPPENVVKLFSIEKEFISKWSLLTVETPVVHLNKHTSKWVDAVLTFKGFTHWQLHSV